MQIFCTFLFREKWQNCENLWSGFQPLLASSKLQIRPCVKAYENVQKHIHRGRLCIPSKKRCRVKNIAMLQYLNKNILSNLQDIPQSCIDRSFLFRMALCPCINIVFQNLSRSIPADQSLTITPSPVADLPPTHAINTCMRSCIIPKQHCNR